MDFGNWLSSQVGLGILRSVLMLAGGVLVTDGILSSATLTAVVGGILAIVTVIVSAQSNKTKADAVAVTKAVDAHPDLKIAGTSTKPRILIMPQGGLSTTGH